MVKDRCFIISAAPTNDKDIELIKSSITCNDFVMCADAGYLSAKKAKVHIDLFVGDCDSLKKNIDACKCEKIILPTEKDDTDTMFCAREAVKRNFKEVHILCASSGRYDHFIANISTLLYLEENTINSTMEDSLSKIWVKNANNKLNFKNHKDSVISIFPFCCNECAVDGQGFKYKLDNITIKPDFPIGVSNEIISNSAELKINTGTALIILNKYI